MTKNNSYNKTANLVLCGLFAALTAICAYINIPLGFTPIPMNLAMLAVFLAGGILGRKYGTVSMIVYVLMGTAGLPVFAGFQSGPGVLAGPTGGFLAGYIAAAFIIGLIIETGEKPQIFSERMHTMYKSPSSQTIRNSSPSKESNSSSQTVIGLPITVYRRKTALYMMAMLAGLIVCYALGTLWFMLLTGSGLYAALAACVIPFIPGDIIKIIAAVFLTKRLRGLTANLI